MVFFFILKLFQQYYQLGLDASIKVSFTPVLLSNSNFSEVAAGTQYSLFLDTNGTMHQVGSNFVRFFYFFAKFLP